MPSILGLSYGPPAAYDGATDPFGRGVPGVTTAVKAPPTTTARDSRSAVLVAMADTFIGGMGHPRSPIRGAAAMEDTFAPLPSPADRRRLRLVVGVLGRPPRAVLPSGRPGALPCRAPGEP